MEQIARETAKSSAAYKRFKSQDASGTAGVRADGRDSSQGSRGSGREKREGRPTYIQRLLSIGGGGRNSSTGSAQN